MAKICLWVHFIFIVLHVSEIFTSCNKKPKFPNGNVSFDDYRNKIIFWLVESKTCNDTNKEYPSFDGRRHNLAKPELGAIGQSIFAGWLGMKRNSSQNWSKAWNEIKHKISLCKQQNNWLLPVLAKEVGDEIIERNRACADKYLLTHPTYEVNYATPYIDGGIIYDGPQYLPSGFINVDESFKEAIPGQNGLTFSLKAMWIILHNMIAEQLHKDCSGWSSEKVFYEARKFTIALQQRIYAYEWLPAFLSGTVFLPPYERYDPSIDPQVEVMFQAAMYLPKSLSNIKDSSDRDHQVIIQYLLNSSCENAEKWSEIENYQQIHTLPDITHARRVHGLDGYKWEQFSKKFNIKDNSLISKFTEKDLKNLDAFIGGSLESTKGIGELFSKIIYDQFRRIRDGDRFWFENLQNTLFSSEEICKINQVHLADVIAIVWGIYTDNKTSSFQRYDKFTYHGSKSKYDIDTPQKLTSSGLTNQLYLICFILSYCLVLIMCAIYLILTEKQRNKNQVPKIFQDKLMDQCQSQQENLFLVTDFEDSSPQKRKLLIELAKTKKAILIHSIGNPTKLIIFEDFNLQIIYVDSKRMVILKYQNHYEMVFTFSSKLELDSFIAYLDRFLTDILRDQKPVPVKVEWNVAKKMLFSKRSHQKLLEMYFRVAFAQAFKIKYSLEEMLNVDTSIASEVVHTQLSLADFAECFDFSTESEFVNSMFNLIERDKKGSICFRQFIDFISVFAIGSEEDKARLLFKLYDINATAELSAKDFNIMISSFLFLTGNLSQFDTTRILDKAGLHRKEKFNFLDFKQLMQSEFKALACTNFNYSTSDNNNSYLSMARSTIQAMYRRPRSESTTTLENVLKPMGHYRYCEMVFNIYLIWFGLFFVVTLFVVLYKTWGFFLNSSLIGIRRYLFSIAKGSSHGIIFSYILLLITGCRNIFTSFEGTGLCRYFPFNDIPKLHYFIGHMSAIFVLCHVVGHIYIFFWFMSFFQEPICNVQMDEEIRNMLDLKWYNPQLLTGLLLVLLLLPIFLFSLPYFLHRLHKVFNLAHTLHPFVILFLVLHCSILQHPYLYLALLTSFVLFLLDFIIDFIKKPVNVVIESYKILPSDVLCVILRQSVRLKYDPGQWISLSIPQLDSYYYHPFILSSAPIEPELRLYLHPKDLFTQQLRSLLESPTTEKNVGLCIKGPYGKGFSRWCFHDIAVFIGDDTGVQYFASVLRDVLYALTAKTAIPCRKVYFFWMFKSQKHFEWVLNLIREVEDNNENNFFKAHLFIIENFAKFDLRTLMMMIFNKYYPKVFGRSIFTGLSAPCTFGKANFAKLFGSIDSLHDETTNIVVFSAGLNGFTNAVERSCREINKLRFEPIKHYFQNC